MLELKPCRICGSKPKVTVSKSALEDYFKVAVQCQKCKIEIKDESDNLELSERKLYGFWNNDENWKLQVAEVTKFRVR